MKKAEIERKTNNGKTIPNANFKYEFIFIYFGNLKRNLKTSPRYVTLKLKGITDE